MDTSPGMTSSNEQDSPGSSGRNIPLDQGGADQQSSSPQNAVDQPNRPEGAPRIRRRNRLITSCLECRRRKLKCDKLAPCTNCTRFQRPCLYLSPAKDVHSRQKLADIKERMGAIEKDLEQTVSKKEADRRSLAAHKSQTKVKAEETDESEDLSDDEVLEPTPLAALELVYEDGVDDELMDLGVQLGKLRVSERIGGWSRPKFVEELNETLLDINSGTSRWSKLPQGVDERESRQANMFRLHASPKGYIGPGPDYIAPSSSVFFPGMHSSQKIMDYLPSKDATDVLMSQYFKAVHYMCRTVHRPTFEVQYTLFWAQLNVGNKSAPSVQALVFAAMFSAAVSMSNEAVTQRFGTSKTSLVDSLRMGTELALAKANFLRTTKIDTLQAFVMYLIPLARAELSKAHSVLIAAAVRLGECIGLHRDGTLYNMSPLETHIRRMLWHQLCILDMRSCDASGPRPQIRSEDYDTKLPLNVNDEDFLDQENPPTKDKSTWTDMTFGRIRAECMEMRRRLWFDIQQIDTKKKSITSVLMRIQKFMTAFETKFLPMIDSSIPFQRVASLFYKLSASSYYVQLLHRYQFNTTAPMPDRLRQVLLEGILGQIESMMSFETDPKLTTWVWYRGALSQYHSALLILSEIYAYPMRKESPRMWKCIDFVFEVPSHLPPKQKAELIVTDLRDRMEVYHQMRKLRSSNAINKVVNSVVRSPPPLPQQVEVGHNTFLDENGEMQSSQSSRPELGFSPPTMQTDSEVSGSQYGGMGAADSMQMPAMEDIDWAEWDKVFNPETNTGDLNIPDFNMADYTGEYDNSTIDPIIFGPTGGTGLHNNIGDMGNLSSPVAPDLTDIHFSPALLPTKNYRNFNYQS